MWMLVLTCDDAAYMHYIGAKDKVLLEPHWEAFALTSEKKETDAGLFRLVQIEWRRLSIVWGEHAFNSGPLGLGVSS